MGLFTENDKSAFIHLQTTGGYTRFTAAFISFIACGHVFFSGQPQALAVATLIAVFSAESVPSLGLLTEEPSSRAFRKPARRKSPQPTVENTFARTAHLPCQAPSLVTTMPPLAPQLIRTISTLSSSFRPAFARLTGPSFTCSPSSSRSSSTFGFISHAEPVSTISL